MKLRRAPILGAALLALLAGLWGGLGRIGWSSFSWQPTLALAHGPLMVCGFLGTLVSLERAVALGRRWMYAAPLGTVAGTVLLLLGYTRLGATLILVGSLVLVALFAQVVQRQPALFTVTLLLGAACWAIGNLLWLVGLPLFRLVLWWAAFLILTVAGERLELGRLSHLPRTAKFAFGWLILAMIASAALASVTFALGARLLGAVLLALMVWLLRFDLARRTVRKPGLTRFVAIALLSGHLWLGVGGLIGLVYGGLPGGPIYDALLHSLFVGFVGAMIFGHAPIILPAVVGIPVRFWRGFYVHLALLHTSLLLRVGGDLLGQASVRRWGGLLNATSLILFLVVTAAAVGHRAARRPINPPMSLPRSS